MKLFMVFLAPGDHLRALTNENLTNKNRRRNDSVKSSFFQIRRRIA
jgi:hypothetical protein